MFLLGGQPTVPDWITALASVAQVILTLFGVVGVLAAIVALQHMRSANFAQTWTAIDDKLQQEKPLAGRVIARLAYNNPAALHSSLPFDLTKFGRPQCPFVGRFCSKPDEPDWVKTWDELSSKYRASDWFVAMEHRAKDRLKSNPNSPAVNLNLQEETHLEAVRAELRSAVSASYRTMEVVANLAIHCEVPGVWDVLVSEYIDSILALFDVGRYEFADRVFSNRDELFESLVLLYVGALDLRTKRDSCPTARHLNYRSSAKSDLVSELLFSRPLVAEDLKDAAHRFRCSVLGSSRKSKS